MSVASLLAAAVVAACPHTLANQLASTHGASQLVTVAGVRLRHDDRVARALGAARRLLAARRRPVAGAASAAAASPTGSARATARRRPARTRSARSSTASRRIPACATAYHRLVCGDWWDEDPSSPGYNTFRHVACGTPPPFGGGSEALWRATTAYQQFAVVEYNVAPDRRPAAARRSSSTTTSAPRRTAASACRSRSSCGCCAGCAPRRIRRS